MTIEEPQLRAAVEAAMQVREKAYAPYSNYQVGCAIVTTAGETFTGCNVENASYGLCCCAERSSISKMVSMTTKRTIRFVVVATRDGGSPCGSCRQVLSEFALGDDFPVYSFAADIGELQRWTIKELLPDAFELD